MSEFFRRIRYLLNRRRLQAELESDMDFHREMAARAGRSNFGNGLRLREQAREAWGWTWLDRLVQDLGFGARILVRSPGFTVIAVLVLAVGVGVNVAVFGLFNLLALKPLPVRDPESLVRLERHAPDRYMDGMAYPSFAFYRDHTKTLAAAMATLGIPPMQFEDDLQPVSASFFTPNYFTELGTAAAYGRLLNPVQDGSASDAPTLVVSYGFWQRRFGGDPSVVGRVVHLNKKPVTIVGVLPYTYAGLGGHQPDLVIPIAQQPYFIEGSKVLNDPLAPSVQMWGRLAPGVTAKAAEEELRALTTELHKQNPKQTWEKEYLQSSPGGHQQVVRPDLYRSAAMVSVLMVLILAVACANLGGLLLARAVTREREIGIRFAVGAGRMRIFRQLCTESLLLAALGAAAGLALGCTVLRIALTAFDAPKWLSATPDWRVLAFAGGVTLAAALFFGLAPALQIARQRQYKTIARKVLVGAQVASSCVLLIVAGLLVRATQHALYSDPGFGYQRLISISPQLDQHGYSPAAATAFLEQMQTRLRATPGIRSTALVWLAPMNHAVAREDWVVDGRNVSVYPNQIAPGFFQTMGMPLLAGRDFAPGDKHAVIVSQSLARIEWAGKNPVGQLLTNGDEKDLVIGVVGDAHINALSEDDAVETYWPIPEDRMAGMTILARTASDPAGLPVEIKAINESLDPKLFPEIRQLKIVYREEVSGVEKIAMSVSLVGLVAVLLAGIGIVGLVAFTVSQRTKEIAIRVALGANPAHVLGAVLRQYVWPVAIGLVAGGAGAAAGSRLLRRALYGVSNLDPAGYAGAIGMLLLIVSLAALLPARRALGLDVARTLHHE